MAKKAAPKAKPTKTAKRSASSSRAAAAPKPEKVVQVRYIRARYDAAETNADSRKHWANADGMSSMTANSMGVRRVLRNRSRYEVANNTYARGIVNTKTNHVIGTGPRLQVETGDEKANEEIASAFSKWSEAVNLGAKLRTMQTAKLQDGESFAAMRTNEKLNCPVKLDLALIECDRVTNPYATSEFMPGKIDGIEYDDAGNPTSYHVLRYHPGDFIVYDPLASDQIPASEMVHWFRCDRPGQMRGIPEITPALPLFAQLRRYTLATIKAAETAANFAMVAQTDVPPDTDEAPPDPFEEIELTPNMLTTLPAGWKLGQVDPMQPVTGYKEFKWEILNEISRCLDMPFNIAACNSSGYNYSSGRLDHQTYYRGIYIEQSECERVILSRLLAAWVEEAALARVIPAALPPIEEWEVDWFWDGQESADAVKDSLADHQNLANGTTNESEIIARDGRDWRRVLRKRAEILKYKADLESEFGVTFPTDMPPVNVPPDNTPPGGAPTDNTPPAKKQPPPKRRPQYAN